MKKISVIVPVYNTVRYLEQCLKSICNQTYSELEIICVDDGSTDGSEKIVDDFAKRDKRIITVHQKNAGESNARNIGLKKASGDYITFVDCDDWLELDMYEQLMNIMRREDADMVACSWFSDSEKENVIIKNRKVVASGKFDRQMLLQYVYERDSYKSFAYMWDKLYKRKLFYDSNDNLILFDENIRLGADGLYLAQLVLNTESAVFLDKPLYHYRQRYDSGCHTEDIGKRLDWVYTYVKIVKLFENQKISENVLDLVRRFLAYHCSNVAEMAYNQGNENALEKCQNLMKQYEEVYKRLNIGNLDYIERYDKILHYNL